MYKRGRLFRPFKECKGILLVLGIKVEYAQITDC